MPRKASVFLIMLFFIFQFFQCVCWSRNSNTLATWCEELTHLKRPWCWERLTAGGEEHDRGWDGWMASSTQWTWVWVDSRNWWWTGRPGMLQLMGLQRVGHDWVTELNSLLPILPPISVYKLRMSWEIGVDIYMLLCIKQITNENLLCSTRNSTHCSMVT